MTKGRPRDRTRVAVVLLLLPLLATCRPGPLDWDAVEALISKDYPQVPGLSPDALAEQLDSGRTEILLLDAREADEFAVSHLRGAHHVGSDAEAAGRLVASAPDALIVAYCSVGYRSAALVTELHDRGHTNAVNLEGSLFRWVGEGRPVYRGTTRVLEVHPYDESWGALLPAHLWAFEPPAAGPP